ncbi:MAG: hypothetical protein WEA58_15005 [Balneolaceae bacterium]
MEKSYKNTFYNLIGVLGIAALVTGCGSVMQGASSGISSAISGAVSAEVERGVSGMLAGYSDAMLYQLAYSQAFMVGGYGVELEDFAEGEGSTWRVESGDEEESHSYTVERALLKKNEDGSSWWYFRYQPEEDEQSIEYEMKMTSELDPMEMYVRDPETGNVEHRVFSHQEEDEELREGEEEIEEAGYRTETYKLENWEDYREGEESITVGNYTFDSTVLLYEGTEEEGDEDVTIRWWLAEDVPGDLLKYVMTSESEGGSVVGEMTDLRRDYTPRFSEL